MVLKEMYLFKAALAVAASKLAQTRFSLDLRPEPQNAVSRETCWLEVVWLQSGQTEFEESESEK